MKRLIITVGISGSGKSTWAHQQFTESPRKVRIVNRDKIRELLFGYSETTIGDYYLRPDFRELEKEVTKYEDTLIYNFLTDNKTVIVDATNLGIDYLERFKYWNVTTEIKMFEALPNTAIARVGRRLRPVSENVIHRQYEKLKTLKNNLTLRPINFETTTIELNKENPNCIIFDVDGTLAHMNGRSPYNMKAVGKDKPDPSTVEIAKRLSIVDNLTDEPPYIIICTGRDETALPNTAKWLKKHDVVYDQIMARPINDNRADWIVKEEMWRKLATTYNIIGMFDDRLQVVRRARSLGLKVFNVEHNNF